MRTRLVYDDLGMATIIPDDPSNLRDYLRKGYRETPPPMPQIQQAAQLAAVHTAPVEAPAASPPPPEMDEDKDDGNEIYVNRSSTKKLVEQLGVSTAAVRLLMNNRPFENFDDLNANVKVEGVDWSVWKERFNFEQRP